jgi:hypothetical protein
MKAPQLRGLDVEFKIFGGLEHYLPVLKSFQMKISNNFNHDIIVTTQVL